MIKIYSTGCPRCNVLLAKLNSAGLDYEVISDVDAIMNKGITTVPVLENDGIEMNFKQAIDWINAKGTTKQ